MVNLTVLDENQKKLQKSSKKIRAFIDNLIDESSFVETDVFMAGKSFVDGSDALGEGVITGYATLNDNPVYIVAQNNEVLGGSLGQAHADKILKCIYRAMNTNTPLISVIDSTGARIGEGVTVLEGYAAIIAAATELKTSVPHIAIVKGNAIGMMGIYASTADFVLMGKDSVMSMTAPLAVKDNIVAKATDAFGMKNHTEKNLIATFSYENEADAKATVAKLFRFLDQPVLDSSDDPNRTAAALNTKCDASAILAAVADDKTYLELYKGFAKSVVTAFASINNIPVGLVITNANGESEKICKDCMKKMKKFIKLLESYDIPLVTFVDCKGLATDFKSEQSGIVMKAAKFMQHIASASIPKIAVITGSAIGFGYAALASKAIGFDYTLAFPTAVIAPVTSEMAVTIEFSKEIATAKDPIAAREKISEQYKLNESSPFVSAKDGYVDNIIEPALLRPYLASAIGMLVK